MNYTHLTNWQHLDALSLLRQIPSPPKAIYVRGQWQADLFTDCVAVVGSRAITEYGKRVIEKIIPQLVFAHKTVVSGFMYGVDQYAHQVCLDNGGKTIAVLGWGINYPLSGEDEKLAERIISTGGILLSEWAEQKPALWTFPVRNRLVVGLCQEVIIVEAAAKSGSLITAKLAQKMKRTLYAVPGPITAKTSAGTNRLIADGCARMYLPNPITNTQDATTIHGAHRDGAIRESPLRGRDESRPYMNPILKLLANEPLAPDEIARKLQLPISEIGAQISILAITGQIMERGGKYWRNERA